VSVPVSGLASNQQYYFALVSTNSSGTTAGALELFTTGQASVSATTGQASAVGSTTATLSGTVNPGGLDTTHHFEYGTSAANLSSSTATVDDGSGSGSVVVSATLHGLKANTTYEVRLVATNAAGTSDGVEQTFTTTAAAAPTVVTNSATGALTSSVTLSGSVNPNGADTKYWFQYGTTPAYGSTTAVVDAGSGTAASQVSATLTKLKPNTAHLFRLVAQNTFGKRTGVSQVATTAATSRAADEQAITTAEQAVQRQAATVANAKASLAATEATIASSETPSATTIAQDRATVSQDDATVAADQQALAQTTLTAPVAGVVTAVNASVGAAVSGSGSTISSGGAASSGSSAGGAATGSGGAATGSAASSASSGSSSLFTIDSLNQLEIVAGFAEADATKIAVGQPATITLPALPNTEVAGRVVAVSATSTVISNVVTYNETIALINPSAAVKEGMTANVSVVDQTATNVLYLPTAAITTTGPASTVQLLQNAKTTVTRVTPGLVGNASTQIVSGIKAGAVVVEPSVSIAAASPSSSTTASSGGGIGSGGGFGGGGGGLGGGGLAGP
jgi:membrane fusion protein, macrolide-specific efflux system